MSITKLSPNWAYQMGPIHFINFLLSGPYLFSAVESDMYSLGNFNRGNGNDNGGFIAAGILACSHGDASVMGSELL